MIHIYIYICIYICIYLYIYMYIYIYVSKTNFLGGLKKKGFWIDFPMICGSNFDRFWIGV